MCNGAPLGQGLVKGPSSESVAPLPVQSVSTPPVPPPVEIPPRAGAAEASVAVLIEQASALARVSGGSVLECFAAIPDPRRRRGIRHSLATILGLGTAAVLAGQITLTDITEWVATAGQQVLAGLGCRRDARGRATAPHPDTVERVFTLLGAQGLADGIGAYLAENAGIGCVGVPIAAPEVLPAIAVDGKAVRGAHPKTVNLREDVVVPALHQWVGGLFDRQNLDATVRALVDSQGDDVESGTSAAAKQRLVDAETVLRRHQAAIAAGVDPTALIEAINEAQAK